MKPLIVLSGPTAAGKTDLSIKLAKKIQGEIISADSMQVYKGMDIGTAKITADEMQGVVHHLIDFLDPKENYDVFSFKQKCNEIIPNIYERNHMPIIAGGTGFYVQAVVYDIGFSQDTDMEYRKELEDIANKKGNGYLYEILKQKDPKSAEIIHENNLKRMIRALEFYHLNGISMFDHNATEREKKSPYDLRYFVLTMDRNILYERINKRVDIMIENGLIDEAKTLYDMGIRNSTAAKGIGYRQLYEYFDGKVSLDRAIYNIKLDTRHFAKRQLTWFRREKDVIWINKDEYENEDKILEFMLERIGDL